jgi:hypothetical protein
MVSPLFLAHLCAVGAKFRYYMIKATGWSGRLPLNEFESEAVPSISRAQKVRNQ